MRALLLMPLIWVASISDSSAQQALLQLFKELNTISSGNVSYSYLLHLADATSNKQIDSISGKLVRIGDNYYDSSSIGITTVSGRYYCKIEQGRRRITVYDLALIRRKLNLVAEHNNGLRVVDSLIARQGTLQLDTVSKKGILKASYELAATGGNCELFIDRSAFRLLKISFEYPQGGDGTSGYVRRYAISQISNEPSPGILNLSRFFTVEGNHVKPVGKYAQYSLKELIN